MTMATVPCICHAYAFMNKLDLVANPQRNVYFFASKGFWEGLYVFAGKTGWVVPTEDKLVQNCLQIPKKYPESHLKKGAFRELFGPNPLQDLLANPHTPASQFLQANTTKNNGEHLLKVAFRVVFGPNQVSDLLASLQIHCSCQQHPKHGLDSTIGFASNSGSVKKATLKDHIPRTKSKKAISWICEQHGFNFNPDMKATLKRYFF